MKNNLKTIDNANDWLAYCHFHLGAYAEALAFYETQLGDPSSSPMYFLFASICKYYLGEFDDAKEYALKGPECPLQNRIQFHISHKMSADEDLLKFHGKLQNIVDDQLTLAGVHYLRSHFEPALDTYKQIQEEHPDYHAVNLYMAMAHYRLDFYDMSLEVLQKYLQQWDRSLAAVNLNACNTYRLYGGADAQAALAPYIEKEPALGRMPLIRHNTVVFNDGQSADKILPDLFGAVPEAKLNLVIYYVRRKEPELAWELIKDYEPTMPPEYILKACVAAMLGQERDDRDLVAQAQRAYQLVGSATTECDTIPGRQAMASCLFLLQQYEDVLVYLDSIKQFFEAEETFHWNYGMALASAGRTDEAVVALTSITDRHLLAEPAFALMLARLYIRLGDPNKAWEMYLRSEVSADTSVDLLQLIGNDCYTAKAWHIALKAFDALERVEPGPENWKAKRGAAMGLLRDVQDGRAGEETIDEIVKSLQNSSNKAQGSVLADRIEQWRSTRYLAN